MKKQKIQEKYMKKSPNNCPDMSKILETCFFQEKKRLRHVGRPDQACKHIFHVFFYIFHAFFMHFSCIFMHFHAFSCIFVDFGEKV